MQPRWIEAIEVVPIGKEANKIEEVVGGTADVDELARVYRDPGATQWKRFFLPVVQAMPLGEVCARSHVSRSAAKETRAGRSSPTKAVRARLSRAAASHVREWLGLHAIDQPEEDAGACAAYLRALVPVVRACPVCGRVVDAPKVYCSPACRQQAYRRRLRIANPVPPPTRHGLHKIERPSQLVAAVEVMPPSVT